jgi:DNA-binding MarR family transcriptional regulator
LRNRPGWSGPVAQSVSQHEAITSAYADDQARARMTLPSRPPEDGAETAGSEPMLLYLIKQVELAVRSHLDDIVRPVGLTALQYTALTVLERRPGLSSAQLARNSFVTAQSMADMITALEGRGLIKRERDQADRRRLVVALTDGGRELLDRYRDEVAALEARMLAGLTKADTSTLRRSLHACHANLAAKKG